MIENTSGMMPVEYKILIEPQEVEQKSSGGIVLATKTTERESMAQVKGLLVAVGGNAFEDWHGLVPKIGDEIYYAKYSGLLIDGIDGKKYRFANDKDIVGVILK